MTRGEGGENHRHGDEPAVEGRGTAEGIVRGVQEEGEQSGHVHGRYSNRVDHMVKPLAGGGGCTGHTGYLAVGGVKTVAEGEEQSRTDAHAHGGRAGDKHNKAGCGAGRGNGGDSVGSDAQGHSGCGKVAGDATIDPAGIGGYANTGLLRSFQGAQGAGESSGKSR